MKHIITLISILLCSVKVVGQHQVEYDFIAKASLAVDPITTGSTSVFKVKNVNKFLYEIKISSSQSEFNSEPPAIFSTIFKIEKKEENTVKQEANKVIENTSETEAKKISAIAYGLASASLFRNQQELQVVEDDLFELNEVADSLRESAKISQLEQSMSNLRSEIESQKITIANLSKAIEDGYLKKTAEIHSKGGIVSESFEQLESIKTIKNRLIRITLTDGLDLFNATRKLDQLSFEYPFILKPEILLSSFQKSYTTFTTSIQLYSVDETVRTHFKNDDAKLKASIIGLSYEVEVLKKKVEGYDYTKLFEEVNQLLAELNNPNNYFVSSDPVQANKDVINYNVKITPRKGIESLTALETRNFNVEVPIKGGVKIDFSTGLFVTSGLYDRKYSTVPTSGDTTKSIITEDKNNSIAQLSLGVLMHVSPKSIGYFKPGFTFGLGLNSTDLSNAQVFVGGSAMFGSNERFIVSTGVSLANVDYLKGKYSLNEQQNNSEIDDSLTEKAMRPGWFISFTYNLTNKKKE